MNILAVDDHPIYLESLEALIKDQIPGVKIFTASDGNEAIQMLDQVNLKLLILDINMPGMNGLEVAEYVCIKDPRVKIIILTHVQGLAMMLNLIPMVDGFLYKEIRKAEFKECIDAVLSGQKFFCKKTTKLLYDNNYKLNDLPDVRLTRRDLEIVEMMKAGKTSKEIAHKMNISVKTVKTYRENLLRKTKTKNGPELVAFVSNNSLLPRDKVDGKEDAPGEEVDHQED